MEDNRVGLVGVGHWGTRLAEVLAAVEGLRLEACTARRAPGRAAFARRFGVRPVESLEALLPEVDLVLLAVPCGDAPDLAGRVLDAGVAAWLEKPGATTRRELAAHASGERPPLFVGYDKRFHPTVVALVEELDGVEVRRVRARFDSPRLRDPGPGEWRLDPHHCPLGPLTQLGVHHLELLDALLGGAPEELRTELRPSRAAPGVPGFVGLRARWAGAEVDLRCDYEAEAWAYALEVETADGRSYRLDAEALRRDGEVLVEEPDRRRGLREALAHAAARLAGAPRDAADRLGVEAALRVLALHDRVRREWEAR